MGCILPVFHNSINRNCSEKQNPRSIISSFMLEGYKEKKGTKIRSQSRISPLIARLRNAWSALASASCSQTDCTAEQKLEEIR